MSAAPLYAKATPDASRGLTADLWQQSLQAYVSNNPAFGVRYSDDFVEPQAANTTDASANAQGWFIQDANAGGTSESLAQVAGDPDGSVTLSAATGTDHFGIEMHKGLTATTGLNITLPTATSNARGRVVYETLVDLDASDNYFVGLSEAIVEFLSSVGALPTDSDFIGFYRADAGDLTFVSTNDNAGGTAVAQSVTLIAAADIPTGKVKAGFAANVDGSVDIVVNGVWYGTLAKQITSLAHPIEALTPKYATTRGATGDLANVAMTIDSIDVFVEANA